MDHERRDAGHVTRVYREDPEACAEAVRYVLKIRARETQPLTSRAENPGEEE